VTEASVEHPHPLLRLVAVMDRLRSPGGCPWDAEQTHESLVEYLLEECYETIEAIETADDEHLREELGDLLLQVVFHARIAEESDPGWGIAEVADGISDKLIRRHPHVFADAQAEDAAAVAENWTKLKAAEKSRDSALDGVPLAMPALALVQKSWRRAAESGLELLPPESGVAAPDTAAELADQLYALAVQAEQQGWDAEALVRDRARHLHQDIRQAEAESATGEG